MPRSEIIGVRSPPPIPGWHRNRRWLGGRLGGRRWCRRGSRRGSRLGGRRGSRLGGRQGCLPGRLQRCERGCEICDLRGDSNAGACHGKWRARKARAIRARAADRDDDQHGAKGKTAGPSKPPTCFELVDSVTPAHRHPLDAWLSMPPHYGHRSSGDAAVRSHVGGRTPVAAGRAGRSEPPLMATPRGSEALRCFAEKRDLGGPVTGPRGRVNWRTSPRFEAPYNPISSGLDWR